MSLLFRIDNFLLNKLNQARLQYLKLIAGKNFKAGVNCSLKKTSRIKIWGKNGRISVGDFFSMGYNSELYTSNGEVNIGNSTSINDNCKIYEYVNIGSNCLLASNIFISSGQHNFKQAPPLPIRAQDKLAKANQLVTIEDDCWIGFGVVIMPGVYIGKGAIIGANAVVTKDIFPYTVNGGIPCREIGKRFEFTNTHLFIEAKNPDHWPFFYSGCNYKQFENIDLLKKGIQIIDTTSIYLLSKVPASAVKLSGWCIKKTKFKIFFNKEAYTEAEVERGSFDLILELINEQSNYSMPFDRMSSKIKDQFNILTVEAGERMDNYMADGYKWAVISIGVICQ